MGNEFFGGVQGLKPSKNQHEGEIAKLRLVIWLKVPLETVMSLNRMWSSMEGHCVTL